jgi:YfiH family protein
MTDAATPDRPARPLGPPAIGAAALARLGGVRHGYFGRAGGVSTGIYASLNAAVGSRDDPAAVQENYARIAGWLGVAPERLLKAHQIHSPRAVVVEAPFGDARPEADALVTATPGLAVAVSTADCAPVLLADAEARVVAAAHAGWRGALGGVLESTLAAMESLGASSSRVVAAVGPSIAQPSYEVGPEFKALFLEESPGNAALFRPGAGDRSWFDLAGYVVRRLGRAGITRVEALEACTFAEPDAWFSHRRSVKQGEPDYGCNLSAILLTEAL